MEGSSLPPPALLIALVVTATIVLVLGVVRVSSALRGLERIAVRWPHFAAQHGLTYSPAGRHFWAGPGMGQPPSMEGLADGVRVRIEASHLGSTNLKRTFVRARAPSLLPGGELEAREAAARSGLKELARFRPVLEHRDERGEVVIEVRLRGHVHDEAALDRALSLALGVLAARRSSS